MAPSVPRGRAAGEAASPGLTAASVPTAAPPGATAASPSRRTSAQIVSEARALVRALETRRPRTPREAERRLFGPRGGVDGRSLDSRPSSAVSLHSHHFEVMEQRPTSRTRLAPLQHKPRVSSDSLDRDPDQDPLPKSLGDPREVARVSRSRARLFRAASAGHVLPDKPTPPHDGGLKRMRSDLGSRDRAHLAPVAVVEAWGERPPDRGGRPPSSPDPPSSPNTPSAPDSPSSPDFPTEAAFWSSHVAPLLTQLEAYSTEGDRPQVEEEGQEERAEVVGRLCGVCEDLGAVLARGGMLAQRGGHGRAALLRVLYRLVDVNSDRLLLHVIKLILSIQVKDKNLLNVCKLVFKISRTENNDLLFLQVGIVELLLGVLGDPDLAANVEALTYCAGAVKFLANSGGSDGGDGGGALGAELLARGALDTLLGLLARANTALADKAMAHLLVQVTAAVRGLADAPGACGFFRAARALPTLCTTLERYECDACVCTNVLRTFSKVTDRSEGCRELAAVDSSPNILIALLHKFPRKQDLVVRVCYTLGNLAARSEAVRERLWRHASCLDVLLHVYALQLQRQPDTDLAEDVLVKLLRVLANLSLHPGLGAALASHPRCIQLLICTLESPGVREREEIVLNAVATVNNLSYHMGPGATLQGQQLRIAELLLMPLLGPGEEGVLEALRALGNLSQSAAVRELLHQHHVPGLLLELLSEGSQDVCYSAGGVLLNMSSTDDGGAGRLLQLGAMERLLSCLQRYCRGDWQLGGLLCKVLWNFSQGPAATGTSGKGGGLDPSDTTRLLATLHLLLDERTALVSAPLGGGEPGETVQGYHRQLWEAEFVPVARRLQKRVQSQAAPLLLEPL
ncbi:armadillo repeat-containing protein 2 isoform X2 [Petromyzon marinus]|uniref:Armadillo repeat-containing protein 2 isoform X2 n=1 Tax=Petromyzon marinus TaxID=7757 RepID=A0AAJ7U2L3_PETMA|nr:armadillo repeat-containing protein 2 isoform X2 [Petromyzon marinus]